MSNGLGELEFEDLAEGEDEFEGEWEDELEGESEDEFEDESEDFFGALSGLFSESESEGEYEDEFEGPNPVNRIYPDAMMEHMGYAASEAESEFEAAEHFLPLIPMVASKLLPIAAKALPKLAGKALPKLARTIARATPTLTRGVSQLSRALHRNPQTRRLLRVVPSIARRTLAGDPVRVASGRPVTPASALRILRRQRRHVLANPQVRNHALRHAHRMHRRFHHVGGLGLLPHRHRHLHRQPRVSGWGGVAPVSRAVAAASGLPGRFHVPGAHGVAMGAQVCPNCGGRRLRRRICWCS